MDDEAADRDADGSLLETAAASDAAPGGDLSVFDPAGGTDDPALD